MEKLDQWVKEDALWRSTPRELWELAMSDVSERMSEMIPGALRLSSCPFLPTAALWVKEAGVSDEDNPFGETFPALGKCTRSTIKNTGDTEQEDAN